MPYFTSDTIVAVDGYWQSGNKAFFVLPVSGVRSIRVNHNAEFWIFQLNKEIPPYYQNKGP